MRKKCVLLVLVALTGLCPNLLFSAPSPEAKLSFMTGEVQVLHEGVNRNGTPGQVIQEGDSVKTGPKSLCIITLKDGSQIKLDAQSQVSIQTQTEILLEKGGAFAKVEKQKLARFMFRTKTATMGVRGTEFFAALGKKSSKGEDVWLCVNEGIVDVESVSGGKAVTVTKGLGVLVPAGKIPTPPKAYSWTKGLNWNMDPQAGEVFNKGSLDSAYKDLRDQNYD